MEDNQYIVDIFKAIVEGTQFRADCVTAGLTGGVNPSFYYGPIDEISATLEVMDKDPARQAYKFPAVFLIQDFDENFGVDIGYYCKTSLHLVIANLSKADWLAPARYTNNFKTVLYPIWTALMEGIKQSGNFKEVVWDEVSYTKTDRMRWGKDGIPGFDFIDAIDIKNLTLTVKIKQT